MRRIYLDYAASTPVDPHVARAMQPYFTEKFGNPGSLHSFGQEAIAAVDLARERIAKAIDANFRELIFTGSATEANNLALRGAIKAFRFQLLGFSDKEASHLKANSYKLKPRVIISAIEHESVLETARDLAQEGVEVVYLPVNREGFVDLKELERALTPETVLVSIMYANNEVGTIQPIYEISRIIRDCRNSKFQIPNDKSISNSQKIIDSKFSILYSPHYPLLHTDAVQAFQFLDCNVGELGIDLMTLSAHKIYGPKGVGALYARQGLLTTPYSLLPIITGGNQEFGLRSGTENVPLIAGFAESVELAVAYRKKETKRVGILRDALWRGLKKIMPHAEWNGGAPVLPNILNVHFPGRSAEEFLTRLDMAGIAASSGSACRARSLTPSYVLRAMGQSETRVKESTRFSLGRPTTKKDIDNALGVIKNILTT